MASDNMETYELTEEQKRATDEFLKGVPRFNVGAFLMPAIWGPAHGLWITILYYPLWIFADNCFVSAVAQKTTGSIVIAVVVALVLFAITLLFGMLSQPYALQRALSNGKTKEEYLKRQRVWAVAMAVVAVLFIILATVYNLNFNPKLV